MTTKVVVPEFNEKELNDLIKIVYHHTGITLGENPRQMLQMRLRTRFRELECTCLGDYINHLNSHREEKQLFINAVTTNETYFFRTSRVWDYIENTFLDKWYSENKGQTLHTWSAASSSGEEAYSLAMIFERFKMLHPLFNYKIMGTDISDKVLQKAKLAKYSGRPIDLILRDRPEMLKTFFLDLGNNEYQVKDLLKKNISFENHNLFNPLNSNNKFDLVLFRNVLIYFNEIDQQRVLSQVSKVIKEDSVLIVGESESLNHLKTDFKYESPLVYSLHKTKAAA